MPHIHQHYSSTVTARGNASTQRDSFGAVRGRIRDRIQHLPVAMESKRLAGDRYSVTFTCDSKRSDHARESVFEAACIAETEFDNDTAFDREKG